MDTEYKETSAALGLDGSAPETATDAGAAEAAPEVSKKTPPVWKWLAPVLLVLAAAAVIFLLIGRKSADDYIAELNYDNGGLVTYDNQYVYYLASPVVGATCFWFLIHGMWLSFLKGFLLLTIFRFFYTEGRNYLS